MAGVSTIPEGRGRASLEDIRGHVSTSALDTAGFTEQSIMHVLDYLESIKVSPTIDKVGIQQTIDTLRERLAAIGNSSNNLQ